MDIPANKWYNAIQIRHSRRKYMDKKINSQLLRELINFTVNINKAIEGARAVVVKENDDEIFTGIVGSYGKIKGAPSYVAFIGDTRNQNYQQQVGYLGESFILEATSKGLGTCWVAGFFKPEIVNKQLDIEEYEEIVAISPLGYAEEKYSIGEKIISKLISSHKRKDLEELCKDDLNNNLNNWVKSALNCARLAPSAINRQPWRFIVNDDSIIISVNKSKSVTKISKKLDCGIAMLHLEIGALYEGVKGSWEYLEAPKIAKFKINDN